MIMARAMTALSADQIINILQQSPDLVLELKSQLADRMQQQGIQIDPNDISDQMLYSQIATNADLRASITTVLRARGYVSDDDLQSSGSSAHRTRRKKSAVAPRRYRLCGGGTALMSKPALAKRAIGDGRTRADRSSAGETIGDRSASNSNASRSE